MINKKYLKLQRSRKKTNSSNFIYQTISKNIIDSIDLVNVKFDEILELGLNDSKIIHFLEKKHPKSNFTRLDICLPEIKSSDQYNLIEMDIDKWNLNKNIFDLIYSNFYIHITDNFEILINNIFNSLKQNGFFIACIPEIDNIYQLINSMYKTDLELYNGAYLRINPTKNIEYILSILKKNNFDIPIINSDKIVIEYSNFNNLLKDMREMSLSYCYTDKKKKFENKNYFKILERNYREKFFNGNYILNIKLNIISAWKK